MQVLKLRCLPVVVVVRSEYFYVHRSAGHRPTTYFVVQFAGLAKIFTATCTSTRAVGGESLVTGHYNLNRQTQ